MIRRKILATEPSASGPAFAPLVLHGHPRARLHLADFQRQQRATVEQAQKLPVDSVYLLATVLDAHPPTLLGKQNGRELFRESRPFQAQN